MALYCHLEYKTNFLELSQNRLLAVPFWIVERAREPKMHSAARLERGEINEKRLGGSGKERDCALYCN